MNHIEELLVSNSALTVRSCIYFAILFLSVYFLPALLRNDVFTNDMSEWSSWAYSYQDRDLFKNDPIKTYWVANFPLGYFFILKLLSPYIDAQILGESLGFALGGLVTFLGFLAGREVTGGKTWGGISVATLIVLSQFGSYGPFSFLNREAGGLPRAFALPIVLLGTLSVLRHNLRGLGWALILGALFYPPVCVILGTYAALALVFRISKERFVPKGLIVLAIFATAAGAILVTATLNSRATTGPLYSLDQMLSMPEFWPGGTSVFFYERWWEYVRVALQLDYGPLSIIWLLFISLTFTAGAIKNDARLLRAEILLIPASAIINYAAAYVFMLRLFEPSRYLFFAYEALTICCFPLFVDYAASWLPPSLPIIPLSDRACKVGWQVGFALITAVGIGVFSARIALKRGGADTMPSEVYEFLRTVPKDALIASTPTDGDRIPMRSRRSVLLIAASLFPYHPLYYDNIKEKFNAVLAAMYGSGPEQLLALKRRYGVRYIIVHNDLAKHDHFSQLRPFKDYIAINIAELGGRRPFILSAVSGLSVFQKGEYSVLDLNRLEQLH